MPEKDPEGKGLISLQRAFLRTGSPSVVSTLWFVDDRAAAYRSGSLLPPTGEKGTPCRCAAGGAAPPDPGGVSAVCLGGVRSDGEILMKAARAMPLEFLQSRPEITDLEIGPAVGPVH